MKRISRPARRFLRRGFTLLEVLAALALSVLLMAAVYAGLDLYYRYSSTGREEVERAQVTRAVLRQIECDLRGVVYHATTEATTSSTTGTSGTTGSSSTSGGSTGGTGGTGGTASTGTTTSSAVTVTMETEDAGVSSASGLFGNSNTLMLHVSHPMREQPFGAVESAHLQSRGSDLLTVSYFVGGSGTGSLQSLVKTPGLVRIQGERLALSLADQQSNLNALASLAESLAPEVLSIQFRYFDGYNWRNNWDSTVFAGLPRAVEIVLEMSPPAERGAKSKIEPAPVRVSTIVSLPLGQPIDTSATP